jgi:hypothetical protein
MTTLFCAHLLLSQMSNTLHIDVPTLNQVNFLCSMTERGSKKAKVTHSTSAPPSTAPPSQSQSLANSNTLHHAPAAARDRMVAANTTVTVINSFLVAREQAKSITLVQQGV